MGTGHEFWILFCCGVHLIADVFDSSMHAFGEHDLAPVTCAAITHTGCCFPCAEALHLFTSCRIDKLFTVSVLRVLSVYCNMKYFFLEFYYWLIAISWLSAGLSQSPIVWLKANTLSAGYCQLGLVCNHGRTAATLLKGPCVSILYYLQ